MDNNILPEKPAFRGIGRTAALQPTRLLIESLRSLSENKVDPFWEWEPQGVEKDKPNHCLCGHSISNNYIIRSMLNGNTAVVGCCCVRRFGGSLAGVFASFRRVAANAAAALNPEAVVFAYKQGWITNRERRFCFNTLRRRGLSAKQRAWREAINRKVLNCMGSAGKGVR